MLGTLCYLLIRMWTGEITEDLLAQRVRRVHQHILSVVPLAEAVEVGVPDRAYQAS